MLLDQIITNSNAQSRDYQTRVITKASDHFNAGDTSVLINSPTGSGKTVMGLAVAALLQRQHNIGIGWVAMRRNLLTQAERANTDLNIGVDCLTTISMFDSNAPTHDAKGRKIDLLVVDEAQHDAASTMSNMHNKIKPKHVLGLSATPFRTDRIKLCFQRVIRDASICELIRLGYLSPYHHYTIDEWTPQHVTERYLHDPQRWGKSAFYWLTQIEAHDCLHRLQTAGVKAEIVLGSQPMSQREETLTRFDEGDLDVLVNLFCLTEGWDCPSLKTSWVRDSSKGPTIQMAGRAYRIHDDHPHKQIVQSKHTKWPIVKTAIAKQQHQWMGDSWRSITPSEKTKKVAARVVRSLASANASLPAFFTNRQQNNRQAVGTPSDD